MTAAAAHGMRIHRAIVISSNLNNAHSKVCAVVMGSTGVAVARECYLLMLLAPELAALIVNPESPTPMFQPWPVPLSAKVTSPLVITAPCTLFAEVGS